MLAAEQRRRRAAAAAEAKLHQGRQRDARALHGRVARRSRPRPRSARSPSRRSTRRRKQLKEAGQRVSFTHLIAYAIARAATEQMPVMARAFEEIDGKPHVLDAGAVNLGIAVDVERKDGGRTLMVPVIRDAGRLSFPEFLDAFNDLITRARDNKLTADDLQGANVSLTNPGGIGTIASVPRLMSGQGTIVATGAIGFPPGLGERRRADRRREGDDDDVDLRPSHHPGRRVRPVPAGRRAVPAGRARLLRAGLLRPRRTLAAAPAPPAASRPPPAPPRGDTRPAAAPRRRRASSCCRPCRPPPR